MTITQSLYQLLEENTDRINERLFHPNFYGDDHKFLRKKERVLSSTRPCIDEALWTFLAACGYAMGGLDGVAKLTKILTGADMPHTNDSMIWLETQPRSPRLHSRNRPHEDNTHVDLAIGSIVQRDNKSGIELTNSSDPWICFCEMKWDSDLSTKVTHDPHRNQLIRVIENAICFQSNSKYASCTHVTLVTPVIFKDRSSGSRLYWYKFEEYQSNNSNSILRDLESPMDVTNTENWRYPSDIANRIEKLTLHWVTFDDLFESIPDSPISDALKTFWKERNEYA